MKESGNGEERKKNRYGWKSYLGQIFQKYLFVSGVKVETGTGMIDPPRAEIEGDPEAEIVDPETEAGIEEGVAAVTDTGEAEVVTDTEDPEAETDTGEAGAETNIEDPGAETEEGAGRERREADPRRGHVVQFLPSEEEQTASFTSEMSEVILLISP